MYVEKGQLNWSKVYFCVYSIKRKPTENSKRLFKDTQLYFVPIEVFWFK